MKVERKRLKINLLVCAGLLLVLAGMVLYGITADEEASTLASSTHVVISKSDTPTANFLTAPDGAQSIFDQVNHRMAQTAQGENAAPVTIIEYGAYGSNECRKIFAHGTVKEIMETYPTQVRYYFVSWPTAHPNDRLATEATFCALDQGKRAFWLYHEALLSLDNASFLQLDHYDDYTALADSLGLDQDKLSACLHEGLYRELTLAMAEIGQEAGLVGIPTFMINGKPVHADALQRAVAAALSVDSDE